jgi:hypothetical protein
MKSALFAILALSALSVAFGVTATYYTDTACATMAANPIAGTPNPSVSPLTTCSKIYTNSATPAVTTYIKYVACAAAISGATTWTDAACTVSSGIRADAVGTCINAGSLVPGVGSYKLDCSSAATSTLAFVSVAAAALALCI